MKEIITKRGIAQVGELLLAPLCTKGVKMKGGMELRGDGITVKLVAIKGKEVTLEVSFTKDGQSLVYWLCEHLKQEETWNLVDCDIRVPCEITGLD